MKRGIKIIYRFGVFAIWVSASFMAFAVFIARGGKNDVITFGFLVLIGVIGLGVQFLWRWVLTQNNYTS